MALHRSVVALLALPAITSAQPGGGEPEAAAAYNRGSEPPHAWSTKPWAPPKSVPLDHVAETYSGMDHEVLAANAQARDDEDRAAAAAEAALEAAADKSPEAFLKAVRTFKPGDYDLLLRCALAQPHRTPPRAPPGSELSWPWFSGIGSSARTSMACTRGTSWGRCTSSRGRMPGSRGTCGCRGMVGSR